MGPVLVLYYSRYGATAKLAQTIAKGIESCGAQAMIRTVPPLALLGEEPPAPLPESGPPYVTHDDLANCSGLALGSPTRFGNMAAPMKHFIDSTSGLWLKGALINKPACVFSSSTSLHGGQESTLLTMMLPLLHHGMVLCGLPYSEPELHNTTTGGTPYGATHVAGLAGNGLSADEHKLCLTQGRRLAELAKELSPLFSSPRSN